MIKKRKDIFQKLPTYTPNKRVWKNIENELDKTNKLSKSSLLKNKLPEYNAPESTWSIIEETLHKNDNKRVLFNTIKVAASLLLILSTSIIIKSYLSNNFNDYSISYEVSSAPIEEELEPFTRSGNIELNKILADKCNNDPIICNNDDFKELNIMLNNLIHEEVNLNNQYIKYKDHEIKNSLIKIENEKATIEKYMLEMFNAKN